MKKRLYLEYDVISGDVSIIENDTTALESFGLLEAAKQMIANRWLDSTDEIETS